MPRPKGSKNKAKTATVPTSDVAALIAEKAAAKESLTADMSNPAHRLYVTIFELMEKPNVFQINDLLKAEGFTPWTRDCDEKKRYAKKSM